MQKEPWGGKEPFSPKKNGSLQNLGISENAIIDLSTFVRGYCETAG